LLRRESERDDEAGRDKRPLHPHIFLDAAASVSAPDGTPTHSQCGHVTRTEVKPPGSETH
jgi:hypothetical protein